MAVLVTRPHPDDETTAAALRARGFRGAARADAAVRAGRRSRTTRTRRYGAVIVTSANALRAIEPHLAGSRLLKLPLFAVGEHTAAAARDAGFDEVIAAEGDAGALARSRAGKRVKAKQLKKASPLLYLAGADLARDLAGELGEQRFYGRHADDLPDGPASEPAARSLRRLCRASDRGGAALFAAQRARLPGGGARRRASKSRRWRCRNAAFRRPSPRSCAMPARPRSWWRRRRTKMPCSRRWTVRCGRGRRRES